MKNMIRITCPECGATFCIPDKEETVKGVSIGKNSDSQLAVETQTADIIFNCTPIADFIRKEGKTVNSPRLFRRWIMGQMFHMLERQEEDGDSFASMIRARGFRYMFKMITAELHDAVVIERNGDEAELKRRMLFFGPSTIRDIARDFAEEIKKEVMRLPTKKCNGAPYKRIPGIGDVFEKDLEATLWVPLRDGYFDMLVGQDIDSVYKNWLNFAKFIRKFRSNNGSFPLEVPTSFVNAFKGNGAYFTLRNMIMFHACSFQGERGNEALKKLDEIALEHAANNESWRLLGVLKEMIRKNGIDISEKIASWRK